jgi:hypothetical protein
MTVLLGMDRFFRWRNLDNARSAAAAAAAATEQPAAANPTVTMGWTDCYWLTDTTFFLLRCC